MLSCVYGLVNTSNCFASASDKSEMCLWHKPSSEKLDFACDFHLKHQKKWLHSVLINVSSYLSYLRGLDTSDLRVGKTRLCDCFLWSCHVHTDCVCVCLCHVEHRSASDGGWFCWYADIQRQIVSVSGLDPAYLMNRTHGHPLCLRYESFEPHPKHPFCYTTAIYTTAQTTLQQSSTLMQQSRRHKQKCVHKPQCTQTQPVTPTVLNNWPHTASSPMHKEAKTHWTRDSAVFMQMKWTA